MIFNKSDSGYILRWSKKIRAANILGGKCYICGNDNVRVLEFHHKNTNIKEEEIGALLQRRWSCLEKELLKCQLVCSSCHQELHVLEGAVDIRIRQLKRDLLKHKGVNSCQDCGFSSETNAGLDFHHRVATEKTFGISKQVIRSKSITEGILNELTKCDVLCRNCHALRHFDGVRFEKLRNEMYKKIDSYKELQAPINKKTVFDMYNNGMKQIEIAKFLKCSKATICKIIKDGP